MWKGTSIAEKFSGFLALYDKLISSARAPTPMVEYNDDGQIIIHLNQLIPVRQDSFNFSYQILFGLLESCLRNQRWNITPIQFTRIKEDLIERVPGLMCDIGGLFAHEVDIIFGFSLTPAAYRLDYRAKGSTGLMKHTETFTFENIDHLLPTRKEKESMDTKATDPKTHVILINRFLGSSPQQRQSLLQNHLVHETQDFFVDQLDALQACHAIAPSLDLLLDLALNFTVEVTVWNRCPVGHPGWEFKCIKRKAGLGDHDGDRPLHGPYGGQFGGFMGGAYNHQPNMGMFNGPYGDIDNGMICELLNLYGLTQIQPLPYQARGRNFPAGLELLELVKERLITAPRPGMFNFTIPNNMMNPNGPGRASHSFGYMDQVMPFDTAVRGEMRENHQERYIPVIPGVTRSGAIGMDISPPTALHDTDAFLMSAVDCVGGRVIHVAVNAKAGTYAIYDCTAMGNFLTRTEYKKEEPWPKHDGLMKALDLPLYPHQTFSFSVSDNMEETLYSLKGQIQNLKLPRGEHERIIAEVNDVLQAKPISSSEHVKLNFTLALPEFMVEGLAAALPEQPPRTQPTGTPRHGTWIIHTDLVDDIDLPERFWALTETTPRNW